MTAKKDVAVAEVKLSDDALAGLTSFNDALALIEETYGKEALVIASDVLGDGFAMLTNKDKLVDEPFIFISWDFHLGDHGEFMAGRIMTQDGKKYILVDGSTGICKTMSEYTEKTGKKVGMVCLKGLRRSDYTYTDENGKDTPATTYYINTEAV